MKKHSISLGFLSLFFSVSAMAQPLTPTDDFDMVAENGEDNQMVDMDMGGVNVMAENGPDGQTVDMDMGGLNVSAQNNSTVASAQTSDGADLSYNVYNVSQKNSDATVIGARVGDVLRYEFSIKSDSNDVVDFTTSLDISNILANTEMVDAGLGNLNGGTITFPSFTQQAPCKKMFTFFVRVKDCEGDKSMTTTGHDLSINVNLTCELAKSGPGNELVWYIMMALVAGFVLIGFVNRKSTN